MLKPSGNNKLSGEGFVSSGGSSRVGLGVGQKASKQNVKNAKRGRPTSYVLKNGINPNAMKQTKVADKKDNASRKTITKKK